MGAYFRLEGVEDALRHLIPLGRVGQAEEVGGVAAYLLSDEAAYISGQILAVDGGATAR
jgi:NAD(P)-dependent dehydrogenase (short-subunit alcohol dehydrogenase family)